MNREFLSEGQFNKKSILENVLQPNNFDGNRAYADMAALMREEKARKFSNQLLVPSVGGIFFSLYNVSRIGQLSPSGKSAALFGTFFFSYLTYGCFRRAQYFAAKNATPVAEEKKE